MTYGDKNDDIDDIDRQRFRQGIKDKISVMIMDRYDDKVISEEIAEKITQYIFDELL